MSNPRSLANLKPFPKGKSGNTSGRPKKTTGTLKDWQEFALESPGVDKNGAALPCRDDTVMRTLYLICIDRRRRDVVKAISIWLDRTRGKTPDKIDLGGKVDMGMEDNPITTVLEQLMAKAKVAEKARDAEAEEEAEEGK